MAAATACGPAALALTGAVATLLVATAVPRLESLGGAHAALMTAGWVGLPSLARAAFLLGYRKPHAMLSAVGLCCCLGGLACKWVADRLPWVQVASQPGSEKPLVKVLHEWVGYICMVGILMHTLAMIDSARSGQKSPALVRVGQLLLAAASGDLVLAVCFSKLALWIKWATSILVAFSILLRIVLQPQERDLDRHLLTEQ